MIKCKVLGSSNDILAVQSLLKGIYKGRYNLVVTESIPEAVAYGANKCTAIFIINDKFVDLQPFKDLRRPEILFEFPGKQFCKRRYSNAGSWRALEIG